MISNIKKYINDFFSKRFVKNISFLGISEVVIRIAKFILLAFAARVLGPQDFGLFSYALALAALIAIIGDFGINRIITRNLAQDFSKAPSLIKGFGVQAALLFVYGVIGFLLILFNDSVQVASLFLILGIFTAGNVLSDFIWAFFRAKETMKSEAMGKTLQAVIILIVGSVLLFSPQPLYGLVVAYCLGSLATLWFAITEIKSLVKINYNFDFSVWFNLAKQSWPIAIIAVSAFVFNEIDSIMLGVLSDYESVGYYNAAYKIVSGLLIPMFILNQVLFPKFSKLPFKESINLVRKNIIGNFILYSLFTVIAILFSSQIINLVYGSDYMASVGALKVLVFVSLLTALMFPLSSISIAKNYLRVNLYLSLAAATINVGLNFALIPNYGFIGAAVSTAFTYMFLLVGFSVALYIINSRNKLSTI